MWSRMRDRIAGLFSRRQPDVEELIRTDNHETAAADQPDTVADETLVDETGAEETVSEETVAEETVAEIEETAEATPSSGPDIVWLDTTAAEESPPTDIPAEPPAAPAAVVPPGNFKFPWTHPVTPVTPVSPVSDTAEVAPEHEEIEPVLELRPEDILAIRSEAIIDEAPVAEALVVETPQDEPIFVENPVVVAEETFTSVEDALPASEVSISDDAAIATEDEAPTQPKRGFFARLFGREAREQEEPRRLSVEVYQDRIEAAANALDVAGENAFTPGEDTLPAADDAFDSVEDALPTDADAFTDTLEPIEVVVPVAGRFMPVEEPLPSIEDLAPEVTAPPLAPPAEEPPEEPVDAAEAEVTPIEAATPSRDTLEIEQKTDEFEILPPEEAAVEEPAAEEAAVRVHGDETISLETKSIWSKSLIGRLFKRGDTEVEKVGVAAAEQAAEGSAVFLLAKFRAFYNEIIRFKHQKSEFTAGFATAIVTDYSADVSPDASAEGLSKRLTELLELQAAEAKWMGGEAGDRYPDAQYAMAALADETFTHMEWEGQTAFPKYSIERKLCQTNAADVEVFRRMDKLLKDWPNSVVARDLARVYLLVIAAGFRGKYRPFGLTRALAEYRHRLYEYIHNGDALMLYAPERTIFPNAAAQTLAGQALRRFSAAQRWAAILIFLVISYTLIAHVAWNRVAADLKDVTARIKSGSTAGAR